MSGLKVSVLVLLCRGHAFDCAGRSQAVVHIWRRKVSTGARIMMTIMLLHITMLMCAIVMEMSL